MPNGQKHLRQFDRFRIDLDKKILWYGDEPVQLPVKAVEVLCELVEKRGEVVTKNELLDHVWQDAFVEESVLSQNIHQLRKAFREFNVGENAIQTIPRRGYRFTAAVENVADDVLLEHEVVERDYVAEISPDSFESIEIGASTRKKPAFRYARTLLVIGSVAAVAVIAVSAWWLTKPTESVAANGVNSIAVLPFSSLNKSDQNETFALGLTDMLIARLAGLNRFAVRPFTSVEKFGESGKDAVEFGRGLRADAALEGTVQRSDGRIRVNLHLIDVRDGRQIWSDSFDENEGDILKLQDAISLKVARALITKLQPADEKFLAAKPTENSEAYRLYLTGRERWLQRNWKAESIAFYQKAIELDPNFALPYLGIADEYAFTYETKVAEDALAKAVELDPNLAEAHATRGFLQMFHHWDWHGAENSFRRALELAPNSSKAHHWYGVYLSLRGRLDEAQNEMGKALELDPTALVIMTDIAELYYFKHDYDRAENELNKVLAIDPDFLNARANMIKVRYKKSGSFFLESATFEVFRQRKLKADGLTQDYDPAELEQIVFRKDEKRLREDYLRSNLAVRNAKPEISLSLSKYYAITGEKERSLDELEKAYETRPFIMPFIAIEPLWDPVREHPRFKQVLRKMGLDRS